MFDVTEKELIELLAHTLSGSSKDHKHRRIIALEELRRRAKSDSIRNVVDSIDSLLQTAGKHGDSHPESSLVVDSLLALIDKHSEAFQRVLEGLEGEKQEKGRLFIVFSNVTDKLDYKKKEQAIGPLVRFLVGGDALNTTGTKEVYEHLLLIGKQKPLRITKN